MTSLSDPVSIQYIRWHPLKHLEKPVKANVFTMQPQIAGSVLLITLTIPTQNLDLDAPTML